MEHAKKGRPRSENPMVHTAVVLPRELLDRLRQDAEVARGEAVETEAGAARHPRGRGRIHLGTLQRPKPKTGFSDGRGGFTDRGPKTSRQGISTEIRRRLQLTYDQEGLPSDPPTSNLVEAIKKLADNLADDLGKKWHEHPYALAAFKAGVATFLAQYQPEGDATKRPVAIFPGRSAAAFASLPVESFAEGVEREPDDPPEAVGRTLARAILRASGGES
jgi:hypothetical protein